MLVRKYTARTLKDALQQVKEDLGEHATILTSRTVGSGIWGDRLEVTAAATPAELPVPKKLKPEKRSAAALVAPKKQAEPRPIKPVEIADVARFLSPLRQELRSLQRQVGSLSATAREEESNRVEETLHELRELLIKMQQQNEAAPTPAVAPLELPELEDELVEWSVRAGMRREVAARLSEKVALRLARNPLEGDAPTRAVAAQVMADQLECMPPLDDVGAEAGCRVVAFVGPPGVGKTATLAKVGARAALMRNLRVGVVGCDSGRLGALAGLSEFARLIEAPFRRARNALELMGACEELGDCHLILVDTSGHSPRDTGGIEELISLLGPVGAEVLLVLNADIRPMEIDANLAGFGALRPHGLVFTKLDQAVGLGALYDAVVHSELPIAYLSNGPQIPEDLEEAEAERTASLIMGLNLN